MDNPMENTARLGINDKRHLFQVLLAMTERLFALNKFPVNQEDFALSLQPPDVEAAWRLLRRGNNKTLSPSHYQYFTCVNDTTWMLHYYPEDGSSSPEFMDVKTLDIVNARRHLNVVNRWCVKQARLEDQLLRSAKVLKAIVHSCNTVGQYKRVSPDLLGFLPEKYREALAGYSKQSPYPAITVEPQEIDTTLATLAYAALQPEHHSEEEFIKRPKWHHNSYTLQSFPRSKKYNQNDVRTLGL